MARAVVLGGAGGIGRVVAKALSTADDLDEVAVADLDPVAADAIVQAVGSPKLSPIRVDATDRASIAKAVAGADVAVSCVGPFYRFGAPVLSAVIDEGIPFVDICDDLDATRAELELDAAARAAGVCALIGMGNSPGLANVLVRYAADHLLDSVERVDITHIHGGEADEGPAVVAHRVHAMVNDVPLFVDGALTTVRMLEESGAAFVEDVEFRDVGTFPVYPYPHPETITLPDHLPGVQRVTNRGVVFPLPYFRLTQDLVARALADSGTPRDGLDPATVSSVVDAVLEARPRLLAQAGVTGPAGCLRIDVAGAKDGAGHTYVFSLSSRSSGAGEGTGIPAALGALMVLRGMISTPGVHPPEAVVDPVAMLAEAARVVPHFGFGGGSGGGDGSGGGAVPIHVAHHLPDGSVEDVELAL